MVAASLAWAKPCGWRLSTGLVGCLESYQSSMQFWYLVFQMLMLPIVLLAAYVGWALPDIYINGVTQSQAQGVDSFLVSLGGSMSISNPLQAPLGEEAGDSEEGAATESSTIADALRQAKQVRVDAFAALSNDLTQ